MREMRIFSKLLRKMFILIYVYIGDSRDVICETCIVAFIFRFLANYSKLYTLDIWLAGRRHFKTVKGVKTDNP